MATRLSLDTTYAPKTKLSNITWVAQIMNKEHISITIGFFAAFCGLIALSISMMFYEIELDTTKSYTYFYQMIRNMEPDTLARLAFVGNVLAVIGIIIGGISFLINKKTWVLTLIALGLGFASFFVQFTVFLLILLVIGFLLYAVFQFSSKKAKNK